MLKRRLLVTMWLMLLPCLAFTVTAQDLGRARQVFPDPRVAALAEAVALGDSTRIRVLAAEGVELSARGDRSVNLLQWALLSRNVQGMQGLLEAGADPGQPGIDGATAVHLAAMANDATYLTVLLARGADPNTPNGRTGAVPLVSAIRGNRHEQFAMLLRAGADPGRADRMGNTPAHEAAKMNRPWRVLDLLNAGADPRAVNAIGVTFQRFLFQTPDRVLLDDVRRGRVAVIEWLQRHGVTVEPSSRR